MIDNGAKALAERLAGMPSAIYDTPTGNYRLHGAVWLNDVIDAILANGAVFLTAEEAERLRRIEAAAKLLDAGWFAVDEGENVRLRYSSDLPALLNTVRTALTEPSHD